MPPPVRGARAPQTKNTSHQRQKVANKSLQEIYEDTCRDQGVHPNSVFFRMLPDRAGAAVPQEHLDLHRNYVGNNGLVPVLAVLQKSPQLRSLDLTENGLRNSAVEKLCAVAAKHPSLTSINLSDNYISETAAAALETLLKENPRITEITLVNTKIDAEARLKLKELAAKNQQAAAAAAATTGAGSPTVAAK